MVADVIWQQSRVFGEPEQIVVINQMVRGSSGTKATVERIHQVEGRMTADEMEEHWVTLRVGYHGFPVKPRVRAGPPL
jgi:hypothetical protein